LTESINIEEESKNLSPQEIKKDIVLKKNIDAFKSILNP